MKATPEEMKVLQDVLLIDEHAYEEYSAMYFGGWKDLALEKYWERLRRDEKKATDDERRDVEEVPRSDVENVELFETYQASIVAELRRYLERLKDFDDWLDGGVDPAELLDEEGAPDTQTGASSTIHSYSRSISDDEHDGVSAPVSATDVLDTYYDTPSSHENDHEVVAAAEVDLESRPSASLPPRPRKPYPPTIWFAEVSTLWPDFTLSSKHRRQEHAADEIKGVQEGTRPLYVRLYSYKEKWGSSGQSSTTEQRQELHRASRPLWKRLCRLYRGHLPNRQEVRAGELAHPRETFKDLFQAYWHLWCHLQRYQKGQAADGNHLAEVEKDMRVLLYLIEIGYCSAWRRYCRQKGLDWDGSVTAAEPRRDLVDVLKADVELHDERMHHAKLKCQENSDQPLDISSKIHPCSPLPVILKEDESAKPDSHDMHVAATLQAELENRPPAPWAPRPRTPYPLAVDLTETAVS